MEKILLLSNCNELKKNLNGRLNNVAHLSKSNFDKKLDFGNLFCYDYKFILIHISGTCYSNAIETVCRLRSLNFNDYIFIIEGVERIQKEELLKLAPILILDYTTSTKESIYNLKSLIGKQFNSKETYENNKNTVNYTGSFELFLKKIKSRKNQFLPYKTSSIELHTNIKKFKLSEREKELFYHLLKGKRSKEISIDMKIEQSTVATFKSRLFKKLEVDSVVELVHYAYKNQLID